MRTGPPLASTITPARRPIISLLAALGAPVPGRRCPAATTALRAEAHRRNPTARHRALLLPRAPCSEETCACAPTTQSKQHTCPKRGY